MAALNELLHSAASGRGRLALVSGAVASGKTQLLNTFTEQVIESGALLLEATGSRAERDLPFEILRKIFDNSVMRRGAGAAAAHLLDEAGADTAGTAARSMRVMSQVSSALLQIAEERTLVVAVDDVHCGDEHSLQFLLHLARRVRQAKVLVVLTESTRLRQEQWTFHAELLRQPNCHHIRLHMLSETGIARLLSEHLPTATATRLAADCQEATGGNPLLLRALLEDWQADGGRGGEHGEPFPPFAPAETFAQAVLACLHRGEPGVLSIARGIAVLGDAHHTRLLSALVGVSGSAVEQAVQDLRQCAVLEGGTFRDVSARTAVLDTMPPGTLSGLHRRAAELLHNEGASALEVGRHLVSARQAAGPWAVPVLREAAEYALVEDEPELALRCLEIAHDACEAGPLRAALKARLVSVVWRLSPAAAEGHLAQLTAELEAGRLSPRDLAMSVSYLAWSGRLDTAAGALAGLSRSISSASPVMSASSGSPVSPVLHVRSALAVPSVASVPTARAASSDPAAVTSPAAAGPDGADADPEEGAAVAAAGQWLTTFSPPLRPRVPTSGAGGGAVLLSGPRDTVGDAYAQAAATLSAALTEGPGDRAVGEAKRVLQRYHLSDNTLQPLVSALLALVYADRLDLALSWCERLLGECSGRRVPAWQALLSGIRGEIALRQGDLPLAAQHARAAMSRISVQSWGVGIALPQSTLIQAETGMGKYEAAMALLEQPIPDEVFQTLPGLHYLRARGLCHLATGRFHAPLVDFIACGRLMDKWAVDHPELVPWRLDAAQAWTALGEREQARSLVDEQLRCGPGGKKFRGVLQMNLARHVDIDRRLPMLKEAVEILESSDNRLQLAVALGELGRAYRTLGEFDRARLLVRKAWHVAKACGAEPLCRQLIPGQTESGELAGTAPGQGRSQSQNQNQSQGQGQDTRSEVEALTEAEARVALLAAHGNTNREIASKLFVTVSTVEQHLTRIYRKLKVKRRRDLPARLSDRNLSSLTGIA